MFLRSVKLLKDTIENAEEYPFSIPTISQLDTLHFHQNVTFFVGENGTGKSTLLEAIASKCEFNMGGGGREHLFDVHAATSDLGDYLRLSWQPKVMRGFFLRAETFYHFATYIEKEDEDGFKYWGGKSLLKQSHGESFLTLFSKRFTEEAIYILDEPEAALSPKRQLEFLKIIYKLCEKGNCQFIISTHSPILLSYPGAQVYCFDDGRIEDVEFEQTTHYQIMKQFMANTDGFLEKLFTGKDGYL